MKLEQYLKLSLYEYINQLFILDSLPLDKLYPNTKGLKELYRLTVKSAWEKHNMWSTKIVLLNYQSLIAHLPDIKCDPLGNY